MGYLSYLGNMFDLNTVGRNAADVAAMIEQAAVSAGNTVVDPANALIAAAAALAVGTVIYIYRHGRAQ